MFTVQLSKEALINIMSINAWEQTLVSSLHGLLNCEKMWIRLPCYYNRV